MNAHGFTPSEAESSFTVTKSRCSQDPRGDARDRPAAPGPSAEVCLEMQRRLPAAPPCSPPLSLDSTELSDRPPMAWSTPATCFLNAQKKPLRGQKVKQRLWNRTSDFIASASHSATLSSLPPDEAAARGPLLQGWLSRPSCVEAEGTPVGFRAAGAEAGASRAGCCPEAPRGHP